MYCIYSETVFFYATKSKDQRSEYLTVPKPNITMPRFSSFDSAQLSEILKNFNKTELYTR